VCQNFGYQIYATLGSFYIPLTVMIIVYYKIFRAARRIVLEERRAQSHLETHSYLEISVKNGGGPPETRVASTASSPAVASAARVQHHRTSTTSTTTTVSTTFLRHSHHYVSVYNNCQLFSFRFFLYGREILPDFTRDLMLFPNRNRAT
jgi:5-hydroxytryptamine receptor 7